MSERDGPGHQAEYEDDDKSAGDDERLEVADFDDEEAGDSGGERAKERRQAIESSGRENTLAGGDAIPSARAVSFTLEGSEAKGRGSAVGERCGRVIETVYLRQKKVRLNRTGHRREQRDRKRS